MLLRDIGSGAAVPLPDVVRRAGASDVVDDTAPATGNLLARVEHAGPGHVAAAVAVARAAQPGWRRTGARERAQHLVTFADVLEAAADELALMECRDT